MAWVLPAAAVRLPFIASSSTERTTSSFRSVMSFETPVVENAAGIVSFLYHAPLANAKKSVHAFADLSMNDGSKTLSAGGIGTADAGRPDCAATGAAIRNAVARGIKRVFSMVFGRLPEKGVGALPTSNRSAAYLKPRGYGSLRNTGGPVWLKKPGSNNSRKLERT